VEAKGAGNGKWYKKKNKQVWWENWWVDEGLEGWNGCGCEYGWMDGDDVDDDVLFL